MYCPSCRAPYPQGVVACPKCREVLVERLEEGTPEWVEYETVLETGDLAFLAIARSLMEGAGIRYFVKHDAVQDLFGLGRIGSGFNVLAGMPKLQVEKDRADEAREILADVRTPEDGLEEDGFTGPDED